MAVKIVSDLHSAVDALRREIVYEDTLLLLGDLVNIIDYTMMDGILIEVFGVDAVQEVIDLRAEKRFDEARLVMAKRREGREETIFDDFQRLLQQHYDEVRRALPHKTYLIGGNVDPPGFLEKLASAEVELVDGKVIEFDGVSVGFAGGGLPTPLHVAGEIPEQEYNDKLNAIGEVDVVCSHVPPDIPELTYDVLAKRHERGSPYLLEHIRKFQPRRVFFGHIHQPLVSSTHVGKTHVINAGYFRRTGRPVDFWA